MHQLFFLIIVIALLISNSSLLDLIKNVKAQEDNPKDIGDNGEEELTEDESEGFGDNGGKEEEEEEEPKPEDSEDNGEGGGIHKIPPEDLGRIFIGQAEPEDFGNNGGERRDKQQAEPEDFGNNGEGERRDIEDFKVDKDRKTPPESFISEYGCKGDSQEFSFHEQLIVKDLIKLDSKEIKEYSSSLIDLSNREIKIIFNCLDDFTLKKVLLNIPINDLINIYNRITSTEFNKIIDKLSPIDKTQIINRIF